MQRKNDIMEMAQDLQIKVLTAKEAADSQMVGIHVLNPDLDALEDAIFEADGHGFEAIVIHSKQTWTHKATVDKVRVTTRLAS
jgi:hypothetical protein